jgi:hypothetical protein
MRRLATPLSVAFLILLRYGNAQEKSDKFAVFVTGLGDAAPVAQSLSKTVKRIKTIQDRFER